MNKKIERVLEKYRQCFDCIDYNKKTSTNVKVYKKRDILIVSGKPGFFEKEPFVGYYDILSTIFEDSEIKIENCVFANICGCHTHIKIPSCVGIFEELILAIDPKISVICGSEAFCLLTNNDNFSSFVGQFINIKAKKKTYKSIVTYHPSYFFKSGKDEEIIAKIRTHFEKAKRLCDAKKKKK